MITEMKNFITCLSFLISLNLLHAQNFIYPTLARGSKTCAAIVPKGWFIKDSVSGDLNGDKKPDLAVIIECVDTVQGLEDGVNKTNPRILFILFKMESGYSKVAQNNTFILRRGEGGMMPDPETKLEIKKGVLHITVQLIRSHTKYKFRYQETNFALIGAQSGGADGQNMIEFWDINFLKKKAKHTIEPIGEGKEKTEWKTVTLDKLKTLSDLKRPYEWEVLPNVYL